MSFIKIPPWFILLNNLVPILGFLFFGWEVFNILFYLWLEAVVTVVIAYILMGLARKKRLKVKSWIFLTAFVLTYLSSYLLLLYGATGKYFDLNLIWYVLISIMFLLLNSVPRQRNVTINGEEQVGIVLKRLIPIMLVGAIIGSVGSYGGIIALLIMKTSADYLIYTKDRHLIQSNSS